MTWMPRQRRCRLMPISRSAACTGEEQERAGCKLASARRDNARMQWRVGAGQRR